ncbi:MAG: YiiX/YebB-like N1pC/P60 family cysteine hydrolase [Pseudomonadota bacterium]
MSTDIRRLANAVTGLGDAVSRVRADAPSESELATIIERGDFRPVEDEAIGYWYARFLTVRESLWDVIDECRRNLEHSTGDEDRLRLFLIGYSAACLLVGIDRVLLFGVARHSVVQRKLNEAFDELRIPRKQFTKIFEAFVNESSAFALLMAMKFANRHRRSLEALKGDRIVGEIARQLPELEEALNPSKREYLRGLFAFLSHKWRRRGVVSAGNVLAGVAEGVGRVASELHVSSGKRVTDSVRATIGDFLRPGDILITRHAVAVTNLFMPGFWPHAALYVGTPEQRSELGVEVPDDKADLWTDNICTLEALKDGVRLRRLSDTLSVDYFVVLRPGIPADGIRLAIERAIAHEGKMYNFDFDFFSSDRLVCTEVIYRAYDGVYGIEIPLAERAGRKTLSAEDLLEFATDEGRFESVAIFGVPGCDRDIAFGDDVGTLLSSSYRPNIQQA